MCLCDLCVFVCCDMCASGSRVFVSWLLMSSCPLLPLCAAPRLSPRLATTLRIVSPALVYHPSHPGVTGPYRLFAGPADNTFGVFYFPRNCGSYLLHSGTSPGNSATSSGDFF